MCCDQEIILVIFQIGEEVTMSHLGHHEGLLTEASDGLGLDVGSFSQTLHDVVGVAKDLLEHSQTEVRLVFVLIAEECHETGEEE
jgi:hypothetical protein